MFAYQRFQHILLTSRMMQKLEYEISRTPHCVLHLIELGEPGSIFTEDWWLMKRHPVGQILYFCQPFVYEIETPVIYIFLEFDKLCVGIQYFQPYLSFPWSMNGKEVLLPLEL